jgi:hypothetical protein
MSRGLLNIKMKAGKGTLLCKLNWKKKHAHIQQEPTRRETQPELKTHNDIGLLVWRMRIGL